MKINRYLESWFGHRLIRTRTRTLDGSVDASEMGTVDFRIPVYDNQREAEPLLRVCSPYTMTSIQRLLVLYNLCKHIESGEVPGDLVECGVWRGGSAGIMAGVNLKRGANRRLWLYDSFQGLPEPRPEDGTGAVDYAGGKVSGKLESIHQCEAPENYVIELLDKIGFPTDRRVLVKGWFQETIPQTRPGHIAVLRLDGDWYESTKLCLDHLYDRVADGGVVIIDDYNAWEGCKKAVDEFLAARKLRPFLHHIDNCARYFFKGHG